jgi:hypothetical protein
MTLTRWTNALQWLGNVCFRRGTESRGRRPAKRFSPRRTEQRHVRIEALEDRYMLSAVTWVGGNAGNWDVAANWSGATLPGASDDVAIDSSSVVTIQSGDNFSVHSLTTTVGSTLSFTGGSLSIFSNSTLSGGLSISGGGLRASGAAVVVTEVGATTAQQASLTADAGATLALPNLLSLVTNGTFQASGAGSVLDVSALTSFTQQGGWNINVNSGGTIKLNGLTSLTSTSGINVSDTGNSKIIAPNLTTLTGVGINLDGSDATVADTWTSFKAGSLTVSTGAYSWPSLTNVDRTNLTVNSGGRSCLFSLKLVFLIFRYWNRFRGWTPKMT